MESLLQIRNIQPKDDTAKSLKDLLTLENVTNDTKVAAQLMLLPHLLPSKAIVKVNGKVNAKKTWKIAIGDSKASIIQHAQIQGDVEATKCKRNDFMRQNGQTVQPYIIIVGKDLKTITNTYVCVDAVLYSVKSVLEALDICFKAFHVFNISYPIESRHLWLLIQKCYYKCTTLWDEIFPHTENTIADLMKKRFQNSNIDSSSIAGSSSNTMQSKKQKSKNHSNEHSHDSSSSNTMSKKQKSKNHSNEHSHDSSESDSE